MAQCMVCHEEYSDARKNFICFDCWCELDLQVHESQIQKKPPRRSRRAGTAKCLLLPPEKLQPLLAVWLQLQLVSVMGSQREGAALRQGPTLAGLLANPKSWREYRQCWCPTPQDCSPCPLRMHTKLSSPKVPKCFAPEEAEDPFQTRLISPRPSSGLTWYHNIPEFQEANSPKG